jgi:hypothetical protein
MRNDNRRELTPRELQRQHRKEQIQRRRLVAALVLLGLIILIIVLVATCGGSTDEETTTTTTTNGETTSTTLGTATYEADLTGADSVPAVETDATGSFLMTYDPENEELTFNLDVENLTAPSVANIYEGAEGEEGTAVYTLFAGPAESGDYSGVLAQGTIDEASLTGSLKGGTLGDLIALINDGKAYVSVGTTMTPVDRIRGQIAETATSTTDTTGDTGSTDTTGEGETTTTTG